jgi:hypothetical protein
MRRESLLLPLPARVRSVLTGSASADDLSGVTSMDEEKARSATKTEIKWRSSWLGWLGWLKVGLESTVDQRSSTCIMKLSGEK